MVERETFSGILLICSVGLFSIKANVPGYFEKLKFSFLILSKKSAQLFNFTVIRKYRN